MSCLWRVFWKPNETIHWFANLLTWSQLKFDLDELISGMNHSFMTCRIAVLNSWMLKSEALNPALLFLSAATVIRTSWSRCSAWSVLIRSLTSLINLKIYCILRTWDILHLSTLSFSKEIFSAKMQKWLNFSAARQVEHGWRKRSKSSLLQPRRSKSRKESGVTKRQSSRFRLAWVDLVIFLSRSLCIYLKPRFWNIPFCVDKVSRGFCFPEGHMARSPLMLDCMKSPSHSFLRLRVDTIGSERQDNQGASQGF